MEPLYRAACPGWHRVTWSAGERIRLLDVPGRQVLRPRQAGAREHLALVLPRGEDRRARPERGREVHPPADHGRQGGHLERSGAAGARRDRRPAGAGARARPGQGRPRQRGGRRPRASRPPRPLQRDLGRVRRAGRRLRRAPRGPGEGAGRDRPSRRLVARRDARPRDGRPPAPRGRPRRHDPLRRRAPARRALPPAPLGARPAAPGRADQPPRRRERLLARALPRRLQGRRDRRHPRPLFPRQRRRLDPRARPRPRHPVPGQLLLVARAEAGAARHRGEAGVRAPPHARPRARVGAHEPESPSREVEGPPRPPTRSSTRRRTRSGSTGSRSTSRPGRASATS